MLQFPTNNRRKKMETSIVPGNDILDKKWQKITYEKHRKRLDQIKGTVRDQNRLNFNYEEVQLQMKMRRAIAEERRQALIDRENRKLLERLVQITTTQRSYFPDTGLHNSKKSKKSKKQNEKKKNESPAESKVVSLPPINTQDKEAK
ncbi:uncharacterized protein LOC116300207 [Actinia tenebrosa]|uniref:Uncharacterized protein LOC116300207 n=1 Tax=Actinia tenebrosa TaxID=6105 RepID=A0A6P8IE53_ACTTE|nr:uncharacterized protein LOC116300207 [Actinia tenebrosa]